MSGRFVYASLFALAAPWFVPGGLVGQGPDSLALSFEREVFAYPEYARRNPFKTLLTADGGGPRFESLLLLGILYSPFAGESVAVFAEGTRTVTPAAPGVPRTVTIEVTGGTYRVKEGVTLGNLTVRTIERRQVTVELDEFGLTETRIMTLSRRTSGGGP